MNKGAVLFLFLAAQENQERSDWQDIDYCMKAVCHFSITCITHPIRDLTLQ